MSWDVTDHAAQAVAGLGTRFFNIVMSGGDAEAPAMIRLKADTTHNAPFVSSLSQD